MARPNQIHGRYGGMAKESLESLDRHRRYLDAPSRLGLYLS